MHDIGILLVSHGTPTTLDDIPEFLANVCGKPAPDAVIQAVRSRYEAIGGSSPLLSITQSQARLLAEKTSLPCLVATRMWHPSIEDVLRTVARSNTPRELVVVPVAPHNEHVYFATVRQVASALSAQGLSLPTLHESSPWTHHQSHIEGWANAMARTLDRIGPKRSARAALVLTAHSLPLRNVEQGDPYPQLVKQTANAALKCLRDIARNSIPPSTLAFQSQGMSAEPWLGPDLLTVFNNAHARNAEGIVLVPIGFPVDHLETLYHIDIEAKRIAEQLGLWLSRVPCLNTDDMLIDAMRSSVVEVTGRLRTL